MGEQEEVAGSGPGDNTCQSKGWHWRSLSVFQTGSEGPGSGDTGQSWDQDYENALDHGTAGSQEELEGEAEEAGGHHPDQQEESGVAETCGC